VGECIPLQPGEATLHHIRLAHRSGPAGPDSQTRLGLAIRYMAAHVQQDLHPRDSGEDCPYAGHVACAVAIPRALGGHGQ
jgi:hypothetical protein